MVLCAYVRSFVRALCATSIWVRCNQYNCICLSTHSHVYPRTQSSHTTKMKFIQRKIRLVEMIQFLSQQHRFRLGFYCVQRNYSMRSPQNTKVSPCACCVCCACSSENFNKSHWISPTEQKNSVKFNEFGIIGCMHFCRLLASTQESIDANSFFELKKRMIIVILSFICVLGPIFVPHFWLTWFSISTDFSFLFVFNSESLNFCFVACNMAFKNLTIFSRINFFWIQPTKNRKIYWSKDFFQKKKIILIINN